MISELNSTPRTAQGPVKDALIIYDDCRKRLAYTHELALDFAADHYRVTAKKGIGSARRSIEAALRRREGNLEAA